MRSDQVLLQLLLLAVQVRAVRAVDLVGLLDMLLDLHLVERAHLANVVGRAGDGQQVAVLRLHVAEEVGALVSLVAAIQTRVFLGAFCKKCSGWVGLKVIG